MLYYLALCTLLLFSSINTDVVYAQLQLPGGTDWSLWGSDTPMDWSLDPDDPVGSNLEDFNIPSSFDLASLSPTTSSVDSDDTLFPQDDLFGNEIAGTFCPSAGTGSKNKFRTRQSCMQTSPIFLPLPEETTSDKEAGSEGGRLPENLGLFESFDPAAYGEMDDDSCPPSKFGDKKYSVCDDGNRDMFTIDQSGNANLQSCKRAYKYLSCPDPSWKWCCEGARDVGTALCRAYGCVPSDPKNHWFDRFEDRTNVPF